MRRPWVTTKKKAAITVMKIKTAYTSWAASEASLYRELMSGMPSPSSILLALPLPLPQKGQKGAEQEETARHAAHHYATGHELIFFPHRVVVKAVQKRLVQE